MSSRRVATISRAAAVLVMVASAIGFIVTLVVGAFVLDNYDAYGEVPIPGTGKVHLPVGQVTVSFHTVVIGDVNGGGLPVPHLVLDIDPPPGVPNPKVTESVGSSTSVNGDIHRRVWVAQIPVDGDYVITTSGEVNGFISPRMAFGHDSDSKGAWLGISAGLFVVGLLGTVLSSVRVSRLKRSAPEPRVWQGSAPATDGPPVVVPSDQGVKIEQLKTLAALRDSGALTEKEFQAEKRKVLDGG
ncbi:SHOCT domain-containing protein [Mycobacterium paraterrae]|uniref:SHOCT domain-containing protein n=1 Tax=Mycobacterium paraterrae TaxID=577492 RepID=A0ABY3VQ09_9MYCO|nr:SHOCT domain-containing protein [Mycobacterium paraterrae]UMB71535.1 SHOCT domain-containing protein [Mycobacterium paraterrae]